MSCYNILFYFLKKHNTKYREQKKNTQINIFVMNKTSVFLTQNKMT